VPASAQKTGVGWYLFQLFTALPVEEYNPLRRRPVVVYALIVANIVAFCFEMIQPSPAAFIDVFGLVPAHLAWWQFITHMFLHGSIAHIAFNMWFLWTFGDNVEDRVGRVRFFVLYLAFGLVAGCTQLIMSLGSNEPLVGASGAIAGLMGAYCVLFPRAHVYQVLFFVRLRLPVPVYLLFWVGLQFVAGFVAIERHSLGGVAWWAHIGGFAAGALWAALNRHRYGDGAELRSR
jgi:membrane associated rhomboid family serine protease